MNGEHYAHSIYYQPNYPYPAHNFAPEDFLDMAALQAEAIKRSYPYHDPEQSSGLSLNLPLTTGQLNCNIQKKMNDSAFTPPQLSFDQRDQPVKKSNGLSSLQISRQRRAERSKVSRAIAKEGFHGLWEAVPSLRDLDHKPTNTRILSEAINYIQEISDELKETKEKLIKSEEKLRASEDALLLFKSFPGKGLFEFDDNFDAQAPKMDVR